jgi:hypothetical protein
MPFVFRYLYFHTIAVCLLLSIRCGETCHALLVLTSRHHKIEWCDVIGYGDVTIVRKNGRQALGFLV